MENFEIARILGEVADLLEIQGANSFRVRAYRNASRAVAQLTRPLAEMVEGNEDLTELPDIGETVAANIVELLETGTLQRLEELGREIPISLVELTRLEGIGPKKAARLWKELDVTDLEQLEAAVKAGRVETLPGFGPKSAAKILAAIDERRKQRGRMLLSEAEAFLTPLLRHMEKAPGLDRLEVAGSYRRRRETIGDLDLLVTVKGEGARVVDHFASYPAVERITGQGDTKGSVVLRSGPAVDLRVVPPESLGSALLYFTGSKEHNVELRTQAVRDGLKVSEWGIFRVTEEGEEGERIAGRTEEECYRVLGLPWIPPELRENRGEIEAARKGALPDLVTVKHLRGEVHAHTDWSDGALSVRELAEACLARGLQYLVVTDHTPAVGVAGGLTAKRVRAQWDAIERAREKVEGIRIFRGLEVDILKDGSLDMEDEVLDELDFVIVAVHTYMALDKSEMTERVVRALRHPAVDLLAHPTGRLLNRREPYGIDMETVLHAAAEQDVAVEINSSPRRLDLSDVHLARARELGVPVAITTDAHKAKDLDNARYGVDQARRAWLERDDVLNARTATQFAKWLRRRHG
ncbi:MAG: DNA polymerase/3'-5' exonuclease PolX [Gemmatimonadota bacterium]